MKNIFPTTVFFLFLAHVSPIVWAQYPNIKIAENSGKDLGPCEPSIAINPTNPDNLVAAAVLDRVYYSTDGGKTWKAQRVKSPYGVWGDPCVVSDSKGNFHFFHLSDPTGDNWSSEEILDRMVCQTSTDGGKKWSQGTYTGLNHPKDQDKEWAAVNPKNNHIYLTWTQFDAYGSNVPTDSSNILFSASEDGGKTWSKAKEINQLRGTCIDDDNTVEGAVPTVGPNGEIYVAWSLGEQIYFDRSLDGGETWLEKDVLATVQKGGWDMEIPGVGRANGMAVTGCDVSNGQHKGTIYINFADHRNGADDTDIWLIKSTDRGDTWSEPKRVNNDAPGKQQFFTWMSVDPVTGYLYFVFYDRRNYDDHQTDVFMAYSKDGGETFTNVKISEKPFTPSEIYQVFFGDYNNITAYHGRIRPIWTRQDGKTLSIWTALIEMKE